MGGALMALVTKSAGDGVTFEEWNELVTALQQAGDLTGIGGTGIDGVLANITGDVWLQPSALTLASGGHTCKPFTIIRCTGDVTISGTLTPQKRRTTITDMAAGVDYYHGMPIGRLLQAGAGELNGASDGEGGGGCFGAGGTGDDVPLVSGGRGFGDNANAANLFTASDLWRVGVPMAGPGGNVGPTKGGAGPTLIILSEGVITISGTIDLDGEDGGDVGGDRGAGAGGVFIGISTKELDGSGGTINARGGYGGNSNAGGGGGYVCGIAPVVTMPTVVVTGGSADAAPNDVGRDGASYSTTALTVAQIRDVARSIIYGGLTGPGSILGLDV